MLRWRRLDRYCEQTGPWRLAATRDGERWRFTLTHDAQVEDRGFFHPVHVARIFDSAEAAKAVAEHETGAGDGHV
ncbi:MAG: hypothetical protein H7A16_09565 [Sinobacteraceae bacterium]|nr:hypothetical protein [Nevskiaceae bacterium]